MRKSFPERVQRQVSAWYRYTQHMRECTNKMLAHYANGYFRGGVSGRSHQPLNLIDRGVQVIAPYLISHNPRVMVHPRAGVNNSNIRAFCRTLELALTHLFNEIKLADYTLRPAVINSLFSMGITKTGTMHSHSVEVGGYLHDVGQPYCDVVHFDDYVGDVAARNRQEMRIEGNRYRLSEEYVKTSGLFKHVDKLKPDLTLYGSTRPEAVGKPDMRQWDYHELHPTVELVDIWLPKDGVIITIPPQESGNKILRTVEWDGPETGPYDTLGYRYFPGSVIPIPPVYTWLDLNKTVNQIATTMRDQTVREKTIGIYDVANAEDAERIKHASHGDLVGVNNPETVKEVTFGGFNDQSLMFLQFLLNQYSKTGPNLDITGGKSSMANTLGQEQIMLANAQRELDDMVKQMHEFTNSISRKLAWFLWSDPLIVLPLIKRVAGIDLQVEYNDASKEGDFLDYTFEIEQYSMSNMNPEMKYQKLMQLISQIVLPTAPIAASQGSILQVDALVKECARYLGITNVDDWWKSAVPDSPGMNPYQPLQGTPKKSNVGQGDNRFGLGNTGASRTSNFNQQQARSGGKSSKNV